MTERTDHPPDENQSTSGADSYFHNAASWSLDRDGALLQSRRVAWFAAAGFAGIAIIEALALVMLVPLKTQVPYLLTVDRQTGFVQALDPLDPGRVAPDAALTKSFLAQYVVARESFDISTLQQEYRKVELWSAGDARSRYESQMRSSTPANPVIALPHDAQVEVQLQSLSSLGPDTALVRFATVRTDPGGLASAPQRWSAVLTYRFSNAAMSAADRLVNPLGFQVLRYRRDPEMTPDAAGPAAAPAPGAARPDGLQHRPWP